MTKDILPMAFDFIEQHILEYHTCSVVIIRYGGLHCIK